MPRIRDFRGVKPSFDGPRQLRHGHQGAHRVPEINFDKVDEVWGIDVNHGDQRRPTDAEAKSLLKHFNMPFNA